MADTQEFVYDQYTSGQGFVAVSTRIHTPEYDRLGKIMGDNPIIKAFIEDAGVRDYVLSIMHTLIYEKNYNMVQPVHLMIAAYLYTRMPEFNSGEANVIGTNERIWMHVQEDFERFDLERFIQLVKENKSEYYRNYQLRLFRYLKLIITQFGGYTIDENA